MTVCSSCGAENPRTKRFCGDCGTPLAAVCASCGGTNEPGKRFCGDCGSPLELGAVAAAVPAAGPVAERRVVSVLFADLVGFTTWSEARDAEEARELLSRYFDLARTLIDRYGGTVEKFIGDAVMAVWGTPTATEDDAERAVRAALDLVASVPDLDPALRARAGVLTGEAAVTIGAQGQGMVAGDLVNTASRIQSAAEPGTVLVGEATRRASEQAVVYERAGEQLLKGKAEPVALSRALRVVSGVRGQLKSAGLEAPFVGRERELKLIKDLFHGSAANRKAHLVSVTGMLLDRGLLVQDGPVYRPTDQIETLEVPETLHALIAARLDGVSPEERRVLQDGAVLGKTFTLAAVAALAGRPVDELEPLLAGLVRKEVLGVQSDPRSPERGQYGFLQDLVRHVAYETLSKRERKLRHLAAIEHLQRAFAEPDEVAEVLASHYLAAFDAAPDAEDAPAIRAGGREMLARAGDRAGSLGAPEEGKRYYAQAAVLADDGSVEAELLEQAGRLAIQTNELVEARQWLERALALFTQAGDARAAARVSAGLADADIADGRLDDATVRLEEAVAQLEQGTPSAELAAALAQLGRARALAGQSEVAGAPLEEALTLAERLQLPEVFVQALTSKALVVLTQGRLAEARILLEAAAERANAEQLYGSALRAQNNLLVVLEASDRYAEVLELSDRSIALARRRGDRRWESNLRTGGLTELFMLGRWDEGLVVAAEETPFAATQSARGSLLTAALIDCERGDLESARSRLAAVEEFRHTDNSQTRVGFAAVEARILRAEGRNADALMTAESVLPSISEISITDTNVKLAVVEAIASALALPDLDKAGRLLTIPESLDPGELTPFLQASAAQLRARLDAALGDHTHVDGRFRTAVTLFREFGLVFRLAVAQLEHGEWLLARARPADAKPPLAEAHRAFDELRATPWLERVQRAEAELPEVSVGR